MYAFQIGILAPLYASPITHFAVYLLVYPLDPPTLAAVALRFL